MRIGNWNASKGAASRTSLPVRANRSFVDWKPICYGNFVIKRILCWRPEGAILNSDTREKLRASGPVIWLQADASTIEQRLGEDQSTCRSRPALTNLGWREEIERVLAERLPLYQQTCHIRIDTAGKTLVEVAEQTEAALRELSKQPGSSQA